MASNSQSASVKDTETVTITKKNYEHCMKMLHTQNSRIRILEYEKKCIETQMKELMNNHSTRTGAQVSDGDGQERSNLEERCKQLLTLLDRQDRDISGEVVNVLQEEQIVRMRQEIQMKDKLIKDLKYCLERDEEKQLYAEARLKNDRLKKIIEIQENQLTEYRIHIDKSLVPPAPAVNGVCQDCVTKQSVIKSLNENLKALQIETDEMRTAKDELFAEYLMLSNRVNQLELQANLQKGSRDSDRIYQRPQQLTSAKSVSGTSDDSFYIRLCEKCNTSFMTEKDCQQHDCQ